MDPIANKSTMRFLSFANEKEDAEKEAKLKEAALKIEQAIAKQKSLSELVDYVPPTNEDVIDLANDTRSLYERLQEQKNKKKEAIDESLKLSNLVSKLDEEDVAFLNEVAKNKREEELKKRQEVYDALEQRKRPGEKKIADEERRLKDSLIGHSMIQKRSQVKSKLLSLIKVKPRPKQEASKPSKIDEKDDLGTTDK